MSDFDSTAADDLSAADALDQDQSDSSEGAGWSPELARIIGSLIEKGLTTPQNYPLSLNALTLACNQTTSRDPIMEMAESRVETLLTEAKADGLARFVHPRSGRGVTKYRQVIDEAYGLETEELALVGVLLLRGPQTVNELRSRTERMASLADNEAVEQVLAELSGPGRQRPALVRSLEREAGRREIRWVQLLCPAQGDDRIGEAPAAAPRRSSGGEDLAEVRAELAEVRAELAELRAAFEAFKGEFG